MIGKLLPNLCKVANVPVLTNHSIRPTSIRAMRRGGFERSDVAFVSGHKSIDSLSNYDALTVHDRTKLSLAILNAPATLDGDKLDLDELARGQKRKADDPAPSTSKDDPVQSTSKKVTFDEEEDFVNPGPNAVGAEFVEFVNDDSGLGDMSGHFVDVDLPVAEVAEVAKVAEVDLPVVQEPKFDQEPALPSSQAHNVAGLIRDHMNSSKELINNYISAMKKK